MHRVEVLVDGRDSISESPVWLAGLASLSGALFGLTVEAIAVPPAEARL